MNRVTVTVDPAGHLVMPESVREAAGIHPGVSFEVLVTDSRIELKPVKLPAVRPTGAQSRGAVQIEAEIDQIYDDLRELVARSADDPEVEAEIERKRGQLHALKVEEAAVLRRRAEAMQRLKPGEGERLLRHAEELLAR
jgi:AbrB family looped-hinge helix DNA binding protein